MASKKGKAAGVALKRSNESASLWNCTLSPGWTKEEADVMRLALMKFGIGNWAQIQASGCLPGKTPAQLNNQTQRMLGQQSTAEFTNLHLDPLVIGEKNAKIQGEHIKRKNGVIVNTGDKLTKELKDKKIEENKSLHGLSQEDIDAIELPIPKPEENSLVLIEQKRDELSRLLNELHGVRSRLTELRKEREAKRLRED